METPTRIRFECENGNTIEVKRPTALDVFEANSLADMGNGNFKETIYFYELLKRCWDRGNDLKYLKNLTHEEGITFHNLIRRFFELKITEDDIKKYVRQSTQNQSQKEN